MLASNEFPLQYGVEVEAILVFHERQINSDLQYPPHADLADHALHGGPPTETQAARTIHSFRRRFQGSLSDRHRRQLQTFPPSSNHPNAARYRRRWSRYQSGALITAIKPDTYAGHRNEWLRPIEDRMSTLDQHTPRPLFNNLIPYGNHPLQIAADGLRGFPELGAWLRRHRSKGVELMIWLNHKPKGKPDIIDYEHIIQGRYTLMYDDTLQGLTKVELARIIDKRFIPSRPSQAHKFVVRSPEHDLSLKRGPAEPKSPTFVSFRSHGIEMTTPILDVNNIRAAQEVNQYVKALKVSPQNSHTYSTLTLSRVPQKQPMPPSSTRVAVSTFISA